MSELKASNLVWKRLRKVLVTTTALAAVGGGVVYAYLGGRILLDADGVITQTRIAVSAPFDSRIKQVYVRPGDFVRAGQKIAMVEFPQHRPHARRPHGREGAHDGAHCAA